MDGYIASQINPSSTYLQFIELFVFGLGTGYHKILKSHKTRVKSNENYQEI